MTARKLDEVLSAEELEALTASQGSPDGSLGFWFYARLGYGLAYVAATVTALALFPERVVAKFDLPPGMMTDLFDLFVPVRLLTVGAVLFAYCFSLIKDIRFTSVSLSAMVIAAANLVNDYAVLFAFARPDSQAAVAIIIALRLGVILCIGLNLRTYRRVRGSV